MQSLSRLRRLRPLVIVAVLCLALILPALPLHAREVDTAYNYDSWGNELAAPQAFEAGRVIRGEDLGIGSFNQPSDVFVAADGLVYMADTGNSRIVILDPDLNLHGVIDCFGRDGTKDGFRRPEGVFVDRDGMLYVADTENGRIVHLDADGAFLRSFGRPESSLIPDSFVYNPTKLVLDSAGRVYVIARNVNQGIIEMDIDGAFVSFMGAIPVTPSPWDYIWKRLSTARQRAAMVSFVPTEYNNIAIDPMGFIYVTSGTLSEQQQIPVRRLNLTGTDIMRRQSSLPIIGDLSYTWTGEGPHGASTFIDVAVHTESSTYSVLDRKRGRIFTYDEDGNLIYIYGMLSEQEGFFLSPTSIASRGRDLFVTDAQLNTLTWLTATAYANNIQAALVAHRSGRYEEAAALWRTVLRSNANSELAYYGLGRTQMRLDDFEGAMHNFRLANQRRAYSDAFQLRLKDIVRVHWPWILLGMAAIVVAFRLLARYKRRLLRADIPTLDGLNYAFYLIFHPFDAFYDIKHEKRGNWKSATVIYFAVALVEIMRRQLTGFVFNMYNPLRLNIVSVVIATLLPYFIWILANWSLTTLMDGKGTMLDIYTATGYGLFPMVLIKLLLIPLSHVMTIEQAAFFTFLVAVANVWSYALIFIGMLITHDYSPGKNIAVTVFSFVGMGLILFIGMLVFDLSGQMINFVRAIVKEIQFRL